MKNIQDIRTSQGKTSLLHLLTISAVLCCLTLQVGAAPRVLPNNFIATEGGTFEGTSLGGFSNTAQVVYGASLVSAAGINIGDSITGLAFRVSQLRPSPILSVADYQIRLATSLNVPGSLDPDFIKNRGQDYTIVRSGPLTFNGTEFPTGASPNAFGPSLSFKTPFTYTGGDLLLEYTHSVVPTTNTGADADFSIPLAHSRFSIGFDTTDGSAFNQDNAAPIVQFEVTAPVVATAVPTLTQWGVLALILCLLSITFLKGGIKTGWI